MLSFVGVYLITGDRGEEKPDDSCANRNELFAGKSNGLLQIYLITWTSRPLKSTFCDH